MNKYMTDNKNLSDCLKSNRIFFIANGDLRLSANQICWQAQKNLEDQIKAIFEMEGAQLVRAHKFDNDLQHGFIWNQRMGIDTINSIPTNAPLVVIISAWQFSHHVLAGLRDHSGPILTISNWDGQWPGLVGLLNLNACLSKMNIPYSTIWSENFDDEYFHEKILQWLQDGKITHDNSHIRDFDPTKLNISEYSLGKSLSNQLKFEKVILGVFDEGCMGMYNAIIEDDILNSCGFYKERLSQAALVAEMQLVTNSEVIQVRKWLEDKGVTFITGDNEAIDLTDNQIQEQIKMYIAAMRIADYFHCDAIGIQYQLGLKDTTAASDLAEGLLNNPDRPPVFDKSQNFELYKGKALPHFNEVDECAGVDALITNRVWNALNIDPSTTLHDIRWGKYFNISGKSEFVWILEISGAAPASHFIDGYRGAISERQPPMYFPLGGGTLKGICKPGEIVWSRVFIQDKRLHVDLGRGNVVKLKNHEIDQIWEQTTKQWPMMPLVLHGISRDQMMARHMSNHIQVAYAPDFETAEKALAIKASMFAELGLLVHICGDVMVG